jgi:hypothetical protein
MKTIYKYPLKILADETVTIPSGAKILTIQFQGSSLFLWAEVETETNPHGAKRILTVGTGMPLPDGDLRYITTVQHIGFVWHIYEERTS